MLDPRQLIDRFDGISRGRVLQDYGVSRVALAQAVRKGEIIRLRPGVFATASAPRFVRTAATHGGALTCSAALRIHEVWVLKEDEHPHVWLGPGGRTHNHSGCSCVRHYRPGKMELGIAPVKEALLHAFYCYGEEFFFCAFESAWNKRRISADERTSLREALPASARWLVDFAHSHSESGLESLVRLRLHLIDISVQAQVELEGVGRVDFVIDKRVILEADGEEHHGKPENRIRDLERDAAASALGYESLRFSYWTILDDWPSVEASVLAALARARA